MPNLTCNAFVLLLCVLQLIHDLVVHSLAEEEVLYPEFMNIMGSKVWIGLVVP